jgi:hypothetical protein
MQHELAESLPQIDALSVARTVARMLTRAPPGRRVKILAALATFRLSRNQLSRVVRLELGLRFRVVE